MDIKNLALCIDDKKNNDFSLTLSPKQKKKGLYINKSEVNLRIKNDLNYNREITYDKRNKIFSADKKDNIHNFIENKNLKEIQVNSNFGINANELIKDKNRLQHIIEAIDTILQRTEGLSYEDFSSDKMLFGGIVYYTLIIGEAAYKLTKPFIESNPQINW